MRKDRIKKVVSLCESLKTFVGQMFDDYHDGIVNNSEAKTKVWQEIELAFSRLSNKKIGNVLFIRSEVEDKLIFHLLDYIGCYNVISVKTYKSNNVKIVYSAILVKNFKDAIEVLRDMKSSANINITRWNYGSSFEDFS